MKTQHANGKRLLGLLTALLLLAAAAPAVAAVQADPLTGERAFPDGSGASDAAFVFRYTLPQFAGTDAATVAVNAYYQALATDLTQTVMPGTYASLDTQPEPGSPAYYTQMDYTVTADDGDYLSVLLTNREFLGNAETERWTANVFAMSGVYAGQSLSLSQAIGLEQEDDTAAQGVSYASQLAYSLVWQIIQSQMETGAYSYDPSLTPEALERVFSPESDFYLDADGNLVFYLQAGDVAGEVDGILTFPFSPAELLSAAQPGEAHPADAPQGRLPLAPKKS